MNNIVYFKTVYTVCSNQKPIFNKQYYSIANNIITFHIYTYNNMNITNTNRVLLERYIKSFVVVWCYRNADTVIFYKLLKTKCNNKSKI